MTFFLEISVMKKLLSKVTLYWSQKWMNPPVLCYAHVLKIP